MPINQKVDLGWTSPGMEYDLIGHSKGGYNIFFYQNGNPCIAQIPFRDEWGRPTGESSEINIKMRPNTFRARGVTKMQPGVLVLKKGAFYQASAPATGNAVIIHYTFMDFSTNLSVARSDVSFPVPRKEDLKDEVIEEEDNVKEIQTLVSATADEKSKKEETLNAGLPAPVEEKTTNNEKPPAEIPPEIKTAPDGKIEHKGINAKITVSSTHTGEIGEGPPESLIDGNLTTRWSSNYSEPQHIIIEFPQPIVISALRLYWETASATRYAISTSANGQDWNESNPVAKKVDVPAPRTDYVPMNEVTAKAIKIDLVTRVNPSWGFSLFEIEVITQEK